MAKKSTSGVIVEEQCKRIEMSRLDKALPHWAYITWVSSLKHRFVISCRTHWIYQFTRTASYKRALIARAHIMPVPVPNPHSS